MVTGRSGNGWVEAAGESIPSELYHWGGMRIYIYIGELYKGFIYIGLNLEALCIELNIGALYI